MLSKEIHVIPIGFFAYVTTTSLWEAIQWWTMPAIVMIPVTSICTGRSFPVGLPQALGATGVLLLIRLLFCGVIALLLTPYEQSLPTVPIRFTSFPPIPDVKLLWLGVSTQIPIYLMVLAGIMGVICIACWFLILKPFVEIRDRSLMFVIVFNVLLQQIIFSFGRTAGFLVPVVILVACPLCTLLIVYLLERQPDMHKSPRPQKNEVITWIRLFTILTLSPILMVLSVREVVKTLNASSVFILLCTGFIVLLFWPLFIIRLFRIRSSKSSKTIDI
jgi:hypothetical protein